MDITFEKLHSELTAAVARGTATAIKPPILQAYLQYQALPRRDRRTQRAKDWFMQLATAGMKWEPPKPPIPSVFARFKAWVKRTIRNAYTARRKEEE